MKAELFCMTHTRRLIAATVVTVGLTFSFTPDTLGFEPVALSTNHLGDTYGGANDPVVAVNPRARQQLVVWLGHEEPGVRVYGRIVDEMGRPLGPMLPISDAASPSWAPTGPTATYNAASGEYLVVWTNRKVPTPMKRTSVILVQRITAAGNEIGPNDFRVAAPELNQVRDRASSAPTVAWDSRRGSYLVAWVGHRGRTHSGPAVILARRLSSRGRPLGARERLVSTRGPTYPSRPALAYQPSLRRYIVAWNGGPSRVTASLRDRRSFLWTARINSEGLRRGHEAFVAKTASRGRAGSPALVLNPRRARLLLFWKSYSGADRSVAMFDQRLNDTGRSMGTVRRISAKRDFENEELSSPVATYNQGSGFYVAAWLLANISYADTHCTSSTTVQTQMLAPSGKERGVDDANAAVDMPGDPPGGPTSDIGYCRPVFIWSLALAPGPGANTLLVWSGAVAGTREQVWTRPLLGS
jgi:hypothetical protein